MFQPQQLAGVVASAGRLPEELSLYRELFERSSDGIAIIDPQGNYLQQNPAHAVLTGYAIEELSGRTPAIHLGDVAFEIIMRELQASGRFQGEVLSRSKSGVERLLELSAFAVHNEMGEVVCYVDVKRDITDRRRNEVEVQRRFQTLNALYSMTTRISRATSLNDIYGSALACLSEALKADRSAILLFDGDGVMRFHAQRGLSPTYCRAVEGHSPWPRGEKDPRPIAINDVSVEMESGELRETVLREGINALAFIPMSTSGNLLGKFMVYFNERHRFTSEELKLAETIASQVALALKRTRSDEATRAREREFRTLADHLPLVIARFDRNYRYLYVNPAVQSGNGRSPRELIGRTIGEVIETPEVHAMWKKRIDRAFETKQQVDFDFTYPTPTGVRTYNTKLVPEFNEDGQVVSVISMANDITDRVQAEEQQRFLAEVSTRLVESLDYESTLANLANLMIETIADVCAIDEVTADGSLRRICVVSRRDDPQLDTTNSISVPLRARGRTLGIITLVADRTRHSYDEIDRNFADELAQRAALVIDNARLYQEAHNASMAKSAFLATMSHELRTPLNAILGYAELMELGIAGSMNDQQRQQLQRINASAWHLLTVIEEILTFSRVEAGREEVRAESVAVKQLLEEATTMVLPAAERKNLQFVVSAPADDVVIRTDRGKVRQILLNLLSNAVKFTEDGAIECRAESIERGVVFMVRDSGPGIASEHQERVFEPFWQATQGSTRRVGGTGLGLAVSRQLAQLLGGEVSLQSAVGEGSTFTVTIPSLKE